MHKYCIFNACLRCKLRTFLHIFLIFLHILWIKLHILLCEGLCNGMFMYIPLHVTEYLLHFSCIFPVCLCLFFAYYCMWFNTVIANSSRTQSSYWQLAASPILDRSCFIQASSTVTGWSKIFIAGPTIWLSALPGASAWPVQALTGPLALVC